MQNVSKYSAAIVTFIVPQSKSGIRREKHLDFKKYFFGGKERIKQIKYLQRKKVIKELHKFSTK